MVEPPDLRRIPRGTVPGEGWRRPTRGQVARRRLAALVLLAAAIVGGLWTARWAIDNLGKSTGPVTTTTAPVGDATYRIIFPEGFTRAQMADRVAAVAKIAEQKRGFKPKLRRDQYLAATALSPLPGAYAGDHRKRSLEGFLFPAAYDLYQSDQAAVLVRGQLVDFRQHWARVGFAYAKSKNLTQYDVLIIASMIEKEVLVPSERPLVAAVIYNRLHAHMPLGIDATLRYGLNIPPTRAITAAEVQSSSPYNTDRFKGLPPTPIANPGLPSMLAAAHPARVNYLFFVRKPDCRHHYFTASAAQFQKYTQAGGLQCSQGKPG